MLCCFLLLVGLTSCISGPPLVDVTQSSYQAEEDHSITLEWSFFTRTDGSLNSINIFCELLTLLRPFVLFHVHEGVEVPESQDEHFAGRVQCDKDVLREGRVRLHVSRLRTDDSGVYKCSMNTGDGSRIYNLKVTAARDRTSPETPGTASGGGDPHLTGSPSQPESRGRIILYCVLGLVLAGILLRLCWGLCFRTCKLHTEGPDQDLNPSPSCCEATVQATTPPCSPKEYKKVIGKKKTFHELLHTVIDCQ